MFKEKLAEQNIRILTSLNEKNLSLEKLAEKVKTKQGKITIPINILKEQNLIKENNGIYSLNTKSESLQNVFDLVNPWLNYFDGSYYEVAKDVANIILKKSWEDVGVEDILLFGSASRGETNPNDLDLLILHSGGRLEEYDIDPYGEKSDLVVESDLPVSKNNLRYGAFNIFRRLGYKEDVKDSACGNIIKRVKDFGIDPPTGHWDFEDEDKFNSLFDVHVLSTNLLEKNVEDFYERHRNGQREDAMRCCRDPTFWHTILSTGKIYDPKKYDFTINVSDKYPNAIELFNSKLK